MSTINKNIIMHGMSGKLGDFVIKQYADKIVVCPKAKPRKNPPSETQQKQISLFTLGGLYAQKILVDPKIKAMFKAKAKPGQSARNVVVSEYCKAANAGMDPEKILLSIAG